MIRIIVIVVLTLGLILTPLTLVRRQGTFDTLLGATQSRLVIDYDALALMNQ